MTVLMVLSNNGRFTLVDSKHFRVVCHLSNVWRMLLKQHSFKITMRRGCNILSRSIIRF